MLILRPFVPTHSAAHKKSPRLRGLFSEQDAPLLELADIRRGRTFLAFDNVEADPVAFGQGFEALPLDRGMMHKQIFTAFLLDESEPF
jgi:hypothetical protein